MDLIVIEAEPFGPGRSRVDEAVRLYRAASGFGVEKDILIFTLAEREYWRASLNHVLTHALREAAAATVRALLAKVAQELAAAGGEAEG